MTAYYNEHDPFAAEWLRELIKAGHIASGIVDERSIEDVVPNELIGFTQCHFFAGIGGWSLALRLAGVPDDYPIWTGSCPCQPFSAAGKGAGFADERHLWPSWYWLIKECRPVVIFGEQVASKATNPWFDLVQADLEAMGYAFGCVPFPAASVGSPHIRDRAYWVADSSGAGLERSDKGKVGRQRQAAERSSSLIRLADTKHNGRSGQKADKTEQDSDKPSVRIFDGRCSALERQSTTGPTNGQWRDADWLFCRDGKWRPVKPGSSPLASGVSNRVGLLRGYGNSIVPTQAAEFIKVTMIDTN